MIVLSGIFLYVQDLMDRVLGLLSDDESELSLQFYRISLFALDTVSQGWCLSLGESACRFFLLFFFIYFSCVFIDDVSWKSNHPFCCHEIWFLLFRSQLFIYLPRHSLIQLLINVIIHVQFFLQFALLAAL